MTKVLVIGLDGANMELIERWSKEGKLPAFRRLLSEGCYGNLESVIPTVTIPAWNCLTSGKNPGKIGYFGFVQKVTGSYNFRFPSLIVKKVNYIWDILSNNGKKVFVLNAPNIQYAHKINGYMVAGGFCLSDSKLAYPPELMADLSKIHYKGDIVNLYKLNSLNDNDLSTQLKKITDIHFITLQYLMEKEFDFGFVVFSELDRIQHRCWDKEKLVLDHYQNIDSKLNDLLDILSRDKIETTLVLVSDHGFGHNNKIFFINEWLSKRKILKVKKKPMQRLITILSTILRRFNLFNIIIAIMKSFFASSFQHIAQTTEKIDVVWEKTKAFSYGTWGTIYINLTGREPKGIVKEEEYEQLRSEIIDGLNQISVKAYRREELFNGDYLKLAPDIIVETDENVNSISGRVFYGNEFRKGMGGAHRKNNGTFIIKGPNIKKNQKVDARMYDIVPTILHIFRMPIPKDMDGKVLKEIFENKLADWETKYSYLNKNEKIRSRVSDLKTLGKI